MHKLHVCSTKDSIKYGLFCGLGGGGVTGISWWWARLWDESYLELPSYGQELFSFDSECLSGFHWETVDSVGAASRVAPIRKVGWGGDVSREEKKKSREEKWSNVGEGRIGWGPWKAECPVQGSESREKKKNALSGNHGGSQQEWTHACD